MKEFRLELRVYDSGTRRFQVSLEYLKEDYLVDHWTAPDEKYNYYSKIWDSYKIQDDNLEVYLRCTGIGASVQCVVLINNAKPGKGNTLTAYSEQTKPTFKSFPIP